MAGPKYGEFSFPSKFGFHGSAGQTHVEGYMRGGSVKQKYAKGGDVAIRGKEVQGVDPGKPFRGGPAKYAKGGSAKGDRREYGETSRDVAGTHEKGESGESSKDKRDSDADEYKSGGTVKQRYAFGGQSRAPKINKAIHAKTHKPTAGMRGLGALGQAAGPSMAPLGAPMGGAAAPPQLGAPMGMKKGGMSRC